MKLCVIGTGYVGLVAGAAFSDFGNQVDCVDIDKKKIDMLNDGVIPIYEPGLKRIVDRNVEKNRLRFTTNLGETVKNKDIVFMAVGTPMGKDGNADLSYLLNAAQMVADNLNGPIIMVNKSTVPVGTCARMQKFMDDKSKEKVEVISNPEFLKEGDAVSDFMKPERVIIGTNKEEIRKIMHELYSPFVRSRDRVIFMDPPSAELTKYASNAFLATRISFMNDLSRLCDQVGADVEFVRKGMGSDSRIGPKFLYPGIGYGGSCFPKDISAIRHLANNNESPLKIVNATHEINEEQKILLVKKMKQHFGKLKDLKVGVLGLSFKPKTDDIREAPAHKIVDYLLQEGARIRAFDPVAMDNFKSQHPGGENLVYCEDLYETATGTDALILCTEWHEFQRPDFARIKKIMQGSALFDGRNTWSHKEIIDNDFHLYSIGRPVIHP
ncbi:MAG: UDP-glucose/GDP-mannose dehydrogenase family protein [Deltaproteobacteria bacterium]|jgi:UDPglucose 6-dehydrogenase|nr:UDP-glucose/GDP-mannose dehydrogenase family protein [Deltaproteobacteria bacterium]